jgi:hypothetical protein
MTEEDRDTTWKGKKYLEHVGEFRQVIRASSPEEIDSFHRDIERFSDLAEMIPGECRAAVLSDSGETTEFRGGDLETLWGTLSVHLLAPESKWLEFTVTLPSVALSGSSRFRFENRNVSTVTLETDGTRTTRKVSVPMKKGAPPPVFEKTSFVELLKHWKESSSVPWPFEFGDNYYPEEELRAKGVHDYEAFAEHFEETKDEQRFRATITDPNGAEIWSAISHDKEALQGELMARLEREPWHGWSFETIRRDTNPREHPLEEFRLRVHAAASQALEIVEAAGADSPIVEVLKLGVRLATLVESMTARARAPERLRDPWRKRRGKGREKHEKKTAKTRHLRAEVSRILREDHKAGNRRKPSEILRKLEKFRLERGQHPREDGDTIKHEKDAKGYLVSHLRKTVIPELRKELSEE